jgi:predicted small metal-binding protein
MRYRIRIEKLDFEHNIICQSQAEINDQQIKSMEKIHNIDVLEETFKQLLKQFREYEQNQSR